MTTRITGLASGLDVDALVTQLMTARKAPLNALNQKKQLMEWKREGYRTISTSLVSMNEKLSKYSLSSSINSKKATVTGATNVTATASGASVNSVLNISVSKLASSSSAVSTNLGTTASSTKLSDIYSGSETSITLNGNCEI
jgi:flagellar hook-associated protein 2